MLLIIFNSPFNTYNQVEFLILLFGSNFYTEIQGLLLVVTESFVFAEQKPPLLWICYKLLPMHIIKLCISSLMCTQDWKL